MAYRKRLIPLTQTGKYPHLLANYLDGKLAGNQLYSHEPSIKGIAQAMAARLQPAGKPKLDREILVKVLNEQYAGLDLNPAEAINIDLLRKPNTFTVTTGHQLNLFTGPLYVPFKLMSVINLCKQLKERYPTHDFVPIYWMATEDHDKDEVDHFNLFGKAIKWDTDQTGGVGQFAWPPDQAFWDGLPTDIPPDAITAYKSAPTWAAATRALVHHWLGKQGIICLDPDDERLKQGFIQIALNDALSQTTQQHHATGSGRLEALGYKTQVNARPINLFYMGDFAGKPIRERLVKEDDQWQVMNTDITFAADDLEADIKLNIRHWSPNVVLRPIYQEAILPNLAYLGGPAEVGYWLQMADVFAFNQIPMPVVLPRAFAQINNKALLTRLIKSSLRFEDMLLEPHQLKALVLARLEGSAQVSLTQEYQLVNQAFATLRTKANAADATLASFVDAQEATVLKTLDNVEKRISKAVEKRHETQLNQALNLRDKIFPNDGMQERSENILAFLINQPDLFNQLMPLLNPLDFALIVLDED